MKWRWAAFVFTWATVLFLLAGLIDAIDEPDWLGIGVVVGGLGLYVQAFHHEMAWPRRREGVGYDPHPHDPGEDPLG